MFEIGNDNESDNHIVSFIFYIFSNAVYGSREKKDSDKFLYIS